MESRIRCARQDPEGVDNLHPVQFSGRHYRNLGLYEISDEVRSVLISGSGLPRLARGDWLLIPSDSVIKRVARGADRLLWVDPDSPSDGTALQSDPCLKSVASPSSRGVLSGKSDH